MQRYFEESLSGELPDVVFFLLGTNEMTTIRRAWDTHDVAAIDSAIENLLLENADLLLKAFLTAAPHAHLAILVTTPPNPQASAYETEPECVDGPVECPTLERMAQERVYRRIVERLLQHFKSQTDLDLSRIHLVPTNVAVDPRERVDPVHPTRLGYEQLGASVYCWIKWWMSAFPEGTAAPTAPTPVATVAPTAPTAPTPTPTELPTPTLKCEKWCDAHPKPWPSKCTWDTCNGCLVCLPPTPASTVAPTAPTPTPTAVPTPTLKCEKWCDAHPKPWSSKCTWDTCNGCSVGDCTADMTIP